MSIYVFFLEQTTNAAIKKSENERKEMLQRYKEEKELRKLKEQREKAKRGVFKVGIYRPNAPGFLPFVPQNPVTVKPKEKVMKSKISTCLQWCVLNNAL